MLSDSQILRLLALERVPRTAAVTNPELDQLGLSFNTGEMWLPEDVQPLNARVLRGGLSARANRLWPTFEIAPQSKSTNSDLMLLGSEAAERALVTEFQSAGRGRRGRVWLSPVARNLAVSFAWTSELPLQQLMGLSLVVGLAVTDALHSLGLDAARLKWPNDVVIPFSRSEQSSLRYAKLCGILIELQRVEHQSMAVIGIGLNHGSVDLLQGSVDQPVADLRDLCPQVERNRALIGITNALADYLGEFEDHGFTPMVETFNELHLFTGREVVVTAAESSAAAALTGFVVSVAPTGGLLLSTVDGPLEVDAGEVSLRPL